VSSRRSIDCSVTWLKAEQTVSVNDGPASNIHEAGTLDCVGSRHMPMSCLLDRSLCIAASLTRSVMLLSLRRWRQRWRSSADGEAQRRHVATCWRCKDDTTSSFCRVSAQRTSQKVIRACVLSSECSSLQWRST